LIRINNKTVFKSFSQGKIIKIWLGVFLLLFSLTVIFYVIVQTAFYLNIKFLLDNIGFYFFINFIGFLFLAFNLSLVLFPQILYGLPIPKLVLEQHRFNPTKQAIQESMTVIPLINENNTTTENTFFSNEYQLEIEKAIHNWLVAKKYLETSASLISVSNYTNIPVHHLTYYFNVQLQLKYIDWRNKLRIEFAKQQIDAGFTKATTIEALAAACGFSSQSTFIRAFKNSVTCTPSEYIKTKQI
jgi:AraC-like DNA-binding protein